MSSKKRILIIDDEPIVRQVAQMALEMVGGHEVLEAEDGEAGLGLAQQAHLDVILLDVQMPGLDGAATLARLQADPVLAAVPVVMLTGQALARASQEFTARGAAGVLSKPFDPMTLAGQLARLLGWGAPTTQGR